MERVLLGFLSVMVALGVAPVAAFAVESADNVSVNDVVALSQADKDAQAAEQIVDEGGTATGAAANGSTIVVSKTIEATGVEDYFDITLGVQIEELPTDNSTAVVVVMDISNTMNDDEEGRSPGADGFTRSRLQNAQAAASEFIREYCGGENLSADRMFGLVTFNTNAQWAAGLELQSVSGDSVETLQSGVNAITAPATPATERFTNMEAGLRLAFNALNGIDAVHKYVIFVTDGFPTTYIDRTIEGNFDNTKAITGYNPYQSGSYVATQVGEDGYFADAVLGLPCTYGTSYSDKAAARAEETADDMKRGASAAGKSGINIFSVGIDIGEQTIQAYVDRATGTYSIVDRTSDSYIVGSATDPQAYREWLAEHIAGGPAMGEEARAYADGDNQEELLSAFDDILSDIRETTGFPFSLVEVSDPMGDYIEFQKFFNVDGGLVDALEGEFAPSSAGELVEDTASFDAAANAIKWNLRQSGYTLTETDEGSRFYAFELQYRVRLMTESVGFPFGENVPTNDDAVLMYEGTDADGNVDDSGSLVFPNPIVQAFVDEPDDPEIPVDPEDPVKPVNLSDFNESISGGSVDSFVKTGDCSLMIVGLIAMTALMAAAGAVVAVAAARKR